MDHLVKPDGFGKFQVMPVDEAYLVLAREL